MQLSHEEAESILDLLSNVTIGEFNTELKRNTLKEVLAAWKAPSKRVTITNVDANKPIEAIKVIRVITDLGLKEAKDLYDSYSKRYARSPTFDIGPIDISTTSEDAMASLKQDMMERNWTTNIRIRPA